MGFIFKRETGQCAPIIRFSHMQLSLHGTVYSRVLERRLRQFAEPGIQLEHCRFFPGCGTVEQLFLYPCGFAEGIGNLKI